MNRIHKLLPLLEAAGVDGLLVTNVHNVKYLSGFTGDSSHLIVSSKGHMFFTDPRYTEQAAMECHSEINVVRWLEDKRCDGLSYRHALASFNIQSLGFESSDMSYGAYQALQTGLPGIELKPCNGLVEQLRNIKDEFEIACLRTASEISDRALELTLPFIREGITEMALVAQLEYQLKVNGAEGLSFDTMILSGKKTSLLHGHPSDKPLEKGDFILFDFGATYKGYHADISRTLILGTANPQQKEIYDLIQRAEWDAIHTVKPGIAATVPDAKVREILSGPYMPYYYQGLGHGTGLEVHEGIRLSQSTQDIFAEGMVFTVEPGIYIPEWGGMRIEDSVVVTAEGVSTLNQFPRELICL